MKNSKLKSNFYITTVIMLFLLVSCSNESLDNVGQINAGDPSFALKLNKASSWEEQVAILEQKMRRYHNFQVAQAQGYLVQAGPYVPQMGYHMINPNLVNGEFNLLEPEILVYHQDENGNMVFGAVEYLVPVVDLENPQPHPEGFIGDEDHWHLNPEAGGWTLHAWVGVDNPDGIFAGFNPNVPAAPNN